MYINLKRRLWQKIDNEIARRLGAKSHKRSQVWRLYCCPAPNASTFLTVEYFDTSGGKFSFAFGIENGAYPDQAATPSDTFSYPANSSFILVRSSAFGFEHARIDVELDWQTPTESLISTAFESERAAALLTDLGVTRDLNHHMANWGVLDALGVPIPISEFEEVERKFVAKLCVVMEKIILPVMQKFGINVDTQFFPSGQIGGS